MKECKKHQKDSIRLFISVNNADEEKPFISELICVKCGKKFTQEEFEEIIDAGNLQSQS